MDGAAADGLHVRRRQGEKRGWNVRGYGAAESGAHLHQVSGHLGSRSHTTTRCNETVDQDQSPVALGGTGCRGSLLESGVNSLLFT